MTEPPLSLSIFVQFLESVLSKECNHSCQENKFLIHVAGIELE